MNTLFIKVVVVCLLICGVVYANEYPTLDYKEVMTSLENKKVTVNDIRAAVKTGQIVDNKDADKYERYDLFANILMKKWVNYWFDKGRSGYEIHNDVKFIGKGSIWCREKEDIISLWNSILFNNNLINMIMVKQNNCHVITQNRYKSSWHESWIGFIDGIYGDKQKFYKIFGREVSCDACFDGYIWTFGSNIQSLDNYFKNIRDNQIK